MCPGCSTQTGRSGKEGMGCCARTMSRAEPPKRMPRLPMRTCALPACGFTSPAVCRRPAGPGRPRVGPGQQVLHRREPPRAGLRHRVRLHPGPAAQLEAHGGRLQPRAGGRQWLQVGRECRGRGGLRPRSSGPSSSCAALSTAWARWARGASSRSGWTGSSAELPRVSSPSLVLMASPPQVTRVCVRMLRCRGAHAPMRRRTSAQAQCVFVRLSGRKRGAARDVGREAGLPSHACVCVVTPIRRGGAQPTALHPAGHHPLALHLLSGLLRCVRRSHPHGPLLRDPHREPPARGLRPRRVGASPVRCGRGHAVCPVLQVSALLGVA